MDGIFFKKKEESNNEAQLQLLTSPAPRGRIEKREKESKGRW